MLVNRFFAPCPRGLEAVLADELVTLGAADVEPVDGGVGFGGNLELMMRVNLHSRIASRVLWRIGGGRYRDERDIYRLARGIDWPLLFSVGRTFKVKTDAVKSPVRSIDYVSLTVKDAICDVFRERRGQRPNIDTQAPDMRVHVFLSGNEVTFYLDTSGEPLFKRGWRIATGSAPLRENLASGILRLAHWTPDTPLLDPMCGSGTFLVEAAMMALDHAPGLSRRFAFEALESFQPATWQRLQAEAQARRQPARKLPLWGVDRDPEALQAARQNLAHAGLEAAIHLTQADFLRTSAPTPSGIIVSNPPYGVRLDELDMLAAFYPQLGDWLKREMAGWTAYVLTADLRLAKMVRLSPSKRTPLRNGALDCRLFEIRVVSGSNRRDKATD
ncbi:THUMP domain-containing class I SAM-dependent RNA methyltransferase [Laribacter hongkongensis]|uniref:THUMP domain-containing class I SAM-dependent RNA methyltransferase n=1 Tax=Laribacter hongkongensis TaxID=168471 RepID=UPI001EFEE297|nr:THUMP domain-containing protein [Laribacter hongkongensis]MCG9098018.1 THUMP domain-containing protein [Laribacter hongkongensis]